MVIYVISMSYFNFTSILLYTHNIPKVWFWMIWYISSILFSSSLSIKCKNAPKHGSVNLLGWNCLYIPKMSILTPEINMQCLVQKMVLVSVAKFYIQHNCMWDELWSSKIIYKAINVCISELSWIPQKRVPSLPTRWQHQ